MKPDALPGISVTEGIEDRMQTQAILMTALHNVVAPGGLVVRF
jgi:hypothetical protein